MIQAILEVGLYVLPFGLLYTIPPYWVDLEAGDSFCERLEFVQSLPCWIWVIFVMTLGASLLARCHP